MTKVKEGQVASEGLEEAVAVNEATEVAPKARKEQTPEDKELLEAGVAKLRELGVSAELSKVLDLVPEWNGNKEDLQVVKETVIGAFEGSDKLKDFIDGAFQEETKAFNGLAKVMPVLNNIKAFYARREKTGEAGGRKKMVQVSIDGKTYSVNASYKDEIATLPSDEKKKLLLAHSDTKEATVVEIL